MDSKENAHTTARGVMAQEKARVLGRKKPRDPRAALLEVVEASNSYYNTL